MKRARWVIRAFPPTFRGKSKTKPLSRHSWWIPQCSRRHVNVWETVCEATPTTLMTVFVSIRVLVCVSPKCSGVPVDTDVMYEAWCLNVFQLKGGKVPLAFRGSVYMTTVLGAMKTNTKVEPFRRHSNFKKCNFLKAHFSEMLLLLRMRAVMNSSASFSQFLLFSKCLKSGTFLKRRRVNCSFQCTFSLFFSFF